MDDTTATRPPSSAPADFPSSQRPHLEPNDWSYLAEGKLHVLLAYHGNNPRFQNHVLRLLKERHPGEEKAHYDPQHERDYVLRVAGPALGHQYLDAGTFLAVSPSFLTAIAEQILPFRPSRRAIYGLDLHACAVECQRDLTRFFPLPSLPPSSSSSPHLTLELKPKAGYTSRSRLVPPEHRFKYQESRFQLMQRYRYALHDTRGLEPEWGELVGGPNKDYTPLDLFSGDRGRMTRALQGLLRNPQNFCQFFVDSQVVFGRGKVEVGRATEAARKLLFVEEERRGEQGEDETTTSPNCDKKEEDDEEEQQEQLKEEREKEEEWLDVLMVVVAQILEQEPLLRRLLRLQAMDVLDVEGAGLVMRRLIALCEKGGEGGRGGTEEALALLEMEEFRGFVDCESEEGAEEGSEEKREEGAGLVSAIVQRLEALLVVRHISERDNHDKSVADANEDTKKKEDEDKGKGGSVCPRHGYEQSLLDEQHAQALAAVKVLTKEECQILLQRWLISLGACDCSIMLSLRRHHAFPSSHPSCCSSFSLSSSGHCQTATEPGYVYFQPHAHREEGDRPNGTSTARYVNMKTNTNTTNTTNSNRLDENMKTKVKAKSSGWIVLGYFMQVVDLGPKSPSKILSKAAMEREIIEVARAGARGGGGAWMKEQQRRHL